MSKQSDSLTAAQNPEEVTMEGEKEEGQEEGAPPPPAVMGMMDSEYFFIFYPLPVLEDVWHSGSFFNCIPAAQTVKLNVHGEEDHPDWLPVSFFLPSLLPLSHCFLISVTRPHSPTVPFSNCVTHAECFCCMAGIQALCRLHFGWLAERPERASRIHSAIKTLERSQRKLNDLLTLLLIDHMKADFAVIMTHFFY